MAVWEFGPVFKQAWTVSAVLINMIGLGMMLGLPTSLIPALQAPDSPIKADLHTASWLASAASLAGIPGFFISSALMDIYGRKITHCLIILPGIVGWLCIHFANGISALLIGRVLTGITTGGTISLGAIIIGEYSSPQLRGIFLNLETTCVYVGCMFVHISGHFYTWRTIAIQATFPQILALIITCTWPGSPAWLASRQQFERSQKSFYWLRGKNESSTRELEALVRAQKYTSSLPKQKLTLILKIVQFFKKFTRKDFLKPLMIVVVSTILLDVCGRHLFPAYALQIIEEITGNKAQSFYYTLCIDAIITSSTILSSIFIKVTKRRTLLFSTGFVAFGVLMIVCTYLFLMSRDIISKDYSWIPIIMFVIYLILANLGCTPIPSVLLGELFPLEHKGAGSALSGIIISLCAMGAIKVTPYLLASVKVYGTFSIFGIIMWACLMILYFTLPETKDRTLQEIEDYFNHGKFVDDKADRDDDVNVKMIS